MGELDQTAKQILAQETPAATNRACRWEPPRELPLGAEVHPDGAIRVLHPDKLRDLPAPWSSLLGLAAVVELKMPGDHTDHETWVRARSRQVIWDQVELLALKRDEREAALASNRPTRPVTLPPHADLVFVAPHLPDWIGAHSELILCGDGVWRVGGAGVRALWVAANDLPLHDALLPFLQVRSGRRRVEFIQWLVSKDELPGWFGRWMEAVKMDPADKELFDTTRHDTPDDGPWATPEQVRNHFIRQVPELRQKLLDLARREGRQEGHKEGHKEGRQHSLRHLFGLRLQRPLTETEATLLQRRAEELGPDHLDELVLNSTAEELEAWLTTSSPVP